MPGEKIPPIVWREIAKPSAVSFSPRSRLCIPRLNILLRDAYDPLCRRVHHPSDSRCSNLLSVRVCCTNITAMTENHSNNLLRTPSYVRRPMISKRSTAHRNPVTKNTPPSNGSRRSTILSTHLTLPKVIKNIISNNMATCITCGWHSLNRLSKRSPQKHGVILRYAKSVLDISGIANKEFCQIAEENARRVDRVLDVRQGELCWVAGTVYMDMPLKPNILDDISKDVSRSLPLFLIHCKEIAFISMKTYISSSIGYLLLRPAKNTSLLADKIRLCSRTNPDVSV